MHPATTFSGVVRYGIVLQFFPAIQDTSLQSRLLFVAKDLNSIHNLHGQGPMRHFLPGIVHHLGLVVD